MNWQSSKRLPSTNRRTAFDGIDDGTEVEFYEENGRLVIVKAVADNPFLKWVGYLGRPGDSDEVVRQMRGHE